MGRSRSVLSSGRPLVNLRGESLGPGHKNVASRCAVVTDGFYEWPGKGLAPFWFHRGDDMRRIRRIGETSRATAGANACLIEQKKAEILAAKFDKPGASSIEQIAANVNAQVVPQDVFRFEDNHVNGLGNDPVAAGPRG